MFKGETTRKSAHTSNHYTILFSELLPSWKNIPKRNKALVCTTEWDKAAAYGNPYIVIPFDETIIAETHKADIWNITKKNFNNRGLHFINDFLKSKFNVKDNVDDIRKFLQGNISTLIELPSDSYSSPVSILKDKALLFLAEHGLKDATFFEFFDDIFSPKNLRNNNIKVP